LITLIINAHFMHAHVRASFEARERLCA
jgi:hypothetical protein